MKTTLEDVANGNYTELGMNGRDWRISDELLDSVIEDKVEIAVQSGIYWKVALESIDYIEDPRRQAILDSMRFIPSLESCAWSQLSKGGELILCDMYMEFISACSHSNISPERDVIRDIIIGEIRDIIEKEGYESFSFGE